jgi:hypothetical protein
MSHSTMPSFEPGNQCALKHGNTFPGRPRRKVNPTLADSLVTVLIIENKEDRVSFCQLTEGGPHLVGYWQIMMSAGRVLDSHDRFLSGTFGYIP